MPTFFLNFFLSSFPSFLSFSFFPSSFLFLETPCFIHHNLYLLFQPCSTGQTASVVTLKVVRSVRMTSTSVTHVSTAATVTLTSLREAFVPSVQWVTRVTASSVMVTCVYVCLLVCLFVFSVCVCVYVCVCVCVGLRD